MDFNRFLKFFNYGYFLSKYEPKFLKTLLKVTESASDINDSLSAGKSQYNKEQVLEKLKSVSKTAQKEKGIEKGFEPEI